MQISESESIDATSVGTFIWGQRTRKERTILILITINVIVMIILVSVLVVLLMQEKPMCVVEDSSTPPA